MTRTDNIKRNLIFNILKFAIQLVLQFILRTILIKVLGAEYLGLNGLFSNIFAFLNLAELGIGTAIVFSMYKPISENDIEKVKSLQSLYKKFYLIISIIILIIGFVITPTLPYLIKNGVSVNINIYILYLMYLANTVAGYFSAHKRSLLFAYQRNDIENKVKTICLIGMTIIQIAALLIFKNYYVYFAITILFTLIESFLIHFSANKLFPEINGRGEKLDKLTKKEIAKNVYALGLNKMCGVIVSSTDNLLISVFWGLTILGAYSNYLLIMTSLASLFGLITFALTGSVGNLIASCDKDYVYDRFKKINFIFGYSSAFCCICLLILFQPFIKIWTGGGVYLLDFSTVILMCTSFYFMRMRTGVGMFKECAGLFYRDRWKAIAEAVVNLVVSIVLAKFIGINGIFIGTIVSTLVAPFWVEPLVLYKHYFKRSVWEYFKRYLLDALIMVASCIICYFVCSLIPDGGIWWLILKFVVCILLSNILLICAYAPTKEFKELFSMGKGMLKQMFSKKK